MDAEQSPIDTFVQQLRGVSTARKLLIDRGSLSADGRVFVDDVEMMLHENVVIGLRTPWVRRVAIPIFKAWRVLKSGNGTLKSRAVTAIEILDQCTDDGLAVQCCDWILKVYTKEKTPAVDAGVQMTGRHH